MPRFQPIDHPSDVGIIVFGANRPELFINAAFGLFSLMADLTKVEPKNNVKIELDAPDQESLLIGWLNELVYYEDAKKMLFKEFTITKLTATRLEAEAWGEKIDLARHQIFRPIKAATYNQLQLGEKEAKIVFDV